MNPNVITAVTGIITIFISWAGAAFISGFHQGTVKARLDVMENSMKSLASTEQLAGVKEDVAEIKGMFIMRLKD